MIPKYIHYCWFGHNKIPAIGERCIDSWKRNMPEYEILCWNEDNFDIYSNPFTKKAYNEKKYAFVSDYVRLKALQEYGGVYMDIDEQVFKNFDELLEDRDVVACFETQESVMMGLLAVSRNTELINEFIQIYDSWNIDRDDNYVANPVLFTRLLVKRGLILNGEFQELDNGRIAIFPNEYFCGYDFNVYKERITDNTCAIQEYAGTWTNGKSTRSKHAHEFLSRVVGEKNYLRIKRIKKLFQVKR